MSITIPADHCSYLADFFGPVVRKKRLDGTAVPITLRAGAGVLQVVARPDNARITALQVELPTESISDPISIEASKFADICRRASGGLEISLTDSGSVRLGNWETFPVGHVSCPEVEGHSQVVDRSDFLRGLATVSWAVSTDLVRPRLTLARFENGFARACDGIRYCECRVESGIVWDVSGFLIPTLARFFENGSEILSLTLGSEHQLYVGGPISLYCPRPSSDYLDLDAVVAEPARQHNNFLLKVNKSALLNAFKDVSVVAGASTVVSLDLFSDHLVVSAQEGGDRAEVTVECAWDGEPRNLKFFTTPVTQLLRVVSGEEISLRLGTSTLRSLTSMVAWEDGIFALVNQARSGG